jgi:hypothetical protein
MERPTPAGPKPIDYRSVHAKALRCFNILFPMLVDLHGFPTGAVRCLTDRDYDRTPAKRRGAPRLVEFQGPGWDGSWHCRGGDGAQGQDLFDLVIYLSGGCDRRAAGELLAHLVSRLVEIAA